jgi:uncharacterized protein DUF3738
MRKYIARAYQVRASQVIGPDWLSSSPFDIDAKLRKDRLPHSGSLAYDAQAGAGRLALNYCPVIDERLSLEYAPNSDNRDDHCREDRAERRSKCGTLILEFSSSATGHNPPSAATTRYVG